MSKAFEVNFDGLVGPTHNYSGLSFGNIASVSHAAALSNPQKAALQGLAKMKSLAKLGFRQAVLPPHERPHVPTLRRLGYAGSDYEILKKAPPELLAACSSAAAMWTANAATVAPSADTADGRVHFTPANLTAKLHRSIEPETTAEALRAIFRDEAFFAHHPALPAGNFFGDEGAANHIRLCAEFGEPGLQVFVYGRRTFGGGKREPKRFPARQTLEASQSIARLHRLDPSRVVFLQQNPAAIDAGVFHNDVASVGNQNLLFYHEQAFVDGKRAITELQKSFARHNGGAELGLLPVKTSQVTLKDAVRSYLFNTQLLTRADGKMVLVAPTECDEVAPVRKFLARLLEKGTSPIHEVQYFDLRESMRNGGGPACLRLRVVLTVRELEQIGARVWLDDKLYRELTTWVHKHYRDRLLPSDLADPSLLEESRAALDELTQILKLGSIYPFQKEISSLPKS
jgi:succinylarginine dihydrolase